MRNVWVDYAKAIGIVLVVYGHVARGLVKAGVMEESSSFVLVDSVIYSFHMPLFFFLSGLFFYESLCKRGGLVVMANKIDTIVYPYVLWSFLQGGVEVALSKWTNGNVRFEQLFYLFAMPRAQFWFLYALFLCVGVGVLIYAKLPKTYFAPAFALGVLFYLLRDYVVSPVQLWYVFSYFSFFALGVLFNEYKGWFFVFRYRLLFPIGGISFFSQWVFHAYLGQTYLAGGWLGFFVAISTLLFVVMLCMCLSDIKLKTLGVLGQVSMTIYLVHILAGSGVRIVLSRALVINDLAVHLIFGVLCGVLIPIIFQIVVKKVKCGWLLSVPVLLSVERRVRVN